MVLKPSIHRQTPNFRNIHRKCKGILPCMPHKALPGYGSVFHGGLLKPSKPN